MAGFFKTRASDIRPADDFGDDSMIEHARQMTMAQYGATHQGLLGAFATENTYNAYRPDPVDVVAAAAADTDLLELDQPKPTPGSRVVPEDYGNVARELGFMPKVLHQQLLNDLLAVLDIPIYDYAQVDAYMRTLRAKAKATIWCWRPLRPADVNGVAAWGSSDKWRGRVIGVETTWLDGSYGAGRSHSAPYDKLVPKRPLQRALAIMKRLGDKVAFFVSDVASPKVEISDPFILVVMRNDPSIRAVFDVWNEPGFDTPPED